MYLYVCRAQHQTRNALFESLPSTLCVLRWLIQSASSIARPLTVLASSSGVFTCGPFGIPFMDIFCSIPRRF